MNNVEERKKAILRAVAFHHTTNNSPSPPAPAPSTATLVVRERESERREGGQGHVIWRACGHSFTPRQNERGPAVSLLHD